VEAIAQIFAAPAQAADRAQSKVGVDGQKMAENVAG